MTNEQDVVNVINDFFTSIGVSLAQSAPISATDPTSFIQNEVRNSCFLHPVGPETILSVLNELKNKGDGLEPITNKILKMLAPSILFPLSHLVNLCFATGIFPTALKVSTVTPVHKAGPKDRPGNYRPISIISPLSKIIEKCIVRRLDSFYNKMISLVAHSMVSVVNTRQNTHC